MIVKKIRNQLLRIIPGACYINGLLHMGQTQKAWNTVDFLSSKRNDPTNSSSLNIKNYNDYTLTLKRYCLAEPQNGKIVEEFYSAKITIESENFSCSDVEKDDVILVCLIKNERKRIEGFLNHYRKIGIRHFAFLDNVSIDGTKEFLMRQKDTNVYSVSDNYTTIRREAWLNRVFSYFGYKHWFVCVDSDELLAYPNCERMTIQEFIALKKKKRLPAVMVDMYPNTDVLECVDKDQDTYERFSYFDIDTYYKISDYKYEAVYGGPRKRVFSSAENDFNCRLTKYPIFYYEKGDFQGCSHYQFPFKKNYSSEFSVALLHYKFFQSDIEKYKERAKSGNYSSGSLEYKAYASRIESNSPLIFYFEGSEKMRSSDDLRRLSITGSEFH